MSVQILENYSCKADHAYTNFEFNILLVQLPLPSNKRVKRIVPMNLLYLASYLLKNLSGINVAILDGQAQDLYYPDIMAACTQRKWDLIAIGYWTVQYYLANNLTKALKMACPETIIVHGGVHPSLFPEDSLEHADYCIIGEGEEALALLVKSLSTRSVMLEEISGLAFKNISGKIIKNNVQPLSYDLDLLPLPAWDLINISEYKIPLHITGAPMLPIIGSRGCPYDCIFCVSPQIWHRRVRHRSPESIVEEMEYIEHKLGVRAFHFWDDNLLLIPDRIEKLCDLILRRKLDIEWIGLSRAEHINRAKSLLPLMRKAGCIGIEVGIESVNPKNYIDINKHQDFEEVRTALYAQKEAGLYPLFTYMAFNPGETISGYYFQKDFLDELQSGLEWFKYFHYFTYPLYLGQFCTPYPGTPLHERSDQLGITLLDEWEDRHHHQINFIPNTLLDDVPLLATNKIPVEYIYLYLRAILTAFWNDFRSSGNTKEYSDNLQIYWRLLAPFLAKCNGEFTLRQIIVKLARECSINYNTIARATSFCVYIFGQLGLIRSGLYISSEKMSIKTIDIPDDEKEHINNILEAGGVKKESIVPIDFTVPPYQNSALIKSIHNNSDLSREERR